MRLTIGENAYILKLRTESVAHEMEAHPEDVASKPLSELTLRELSNAVSRMRRNKRKATHRKCRTTATLIRAAVSDVAPETQLASVTVANCLGDQFNAPLGRREAVEKLKLTLLDLPEWNTSMNRALTTAFYERYPNSRPCHSK